MNLKKYLYIVALAFSLNIILSCNNKTSVNIIYYYLANRSWEEIIKEDINGNQYSASYTIYNFYPDFRLTKRCTIDPLCTSDNNGSWALSANNQYVTILTISGTTIAEIILINQNALKLKPINSNYIYTFRPVL